LRAVNVCTIIAKNYVAYARVLARSLAEHNPGSRLFTLIIDDFAGYVDPVEEPFEVLTPADVGCEPFRHMALRYSVLELSTAVKPWLLRHLLGETGGPVTYLDPDIKVFGSLERLDELAGRHGLVLTPHNSAPIPPDDRRPSQVDIMIAGVYNLGYVSLSPGPEGDQLLGWWGDRLRRDCRVDPRWGYFVDQRWFDLAPGFMSDLAIVRDAKYNVAYWNLHSRRLEHDGERYQVNGTPLAFFHFSGFDPDHPLVLSRHQDRVDVPSHSALERILGEYAADVMGQGHRVTWTWPYTFSALPDGIQLDDMVRDLYDVFEGERGRNGGPPSPFTPEGARLFEDWLKEQAPGAPQGVDRVLAHVYEGRADLRGAYPDLRGADRAGLLRWAREYGGREVPLLARVMTRPDDPGGVRAFPASTGQELIPVSVRKPSYPLRAAPWGVNVVGYFRSELGTGEAARQVVRALDAKEIPVLPIHGQAIPLNRQAHAYETATPKDATFPVNLICMNADMLPEFAHQAGDQFFAGRYSIGLWFWEISRFPERWRDSFSLVEEVWAPTAHIATALESLATVPVNTVRIPVSPPTFEPRSRAELGLPAQKFLFLFSFDYLSVFKRKNPLAVIEAFTRAFEEGEGAALLLKCINHEHDADAHAELLTAAGAHTDIGVIDRYLSPSDNSCLTALCDSYVSLHRAEGFGLGMAEAMSLGKPVIATGYSGNLDFMTATNSLLVDHRLAPIGPGAEPYPADAEWAEPDIEHAATLMRRLFDDRGFADELGAVAAADIRRTHSPAAAGEIMHRRLESVRATGRVRHPVDQTRERSRVLARLPLRVRQGPPPVAPGAGRARALLRHATLRLMQPFTAYQQTVNAELLAALQEVDDGIVSVRREAADERARLLARLRGSEANLRSLSAHVEGHGAGIVEIKDMLRLDTDRSIYLAIAELQRRHSQIGSHSGRPSGTRALSGFELRAFSQNGEDGVIAEILRRTGAHTRTFVEFGVESGREGNCVYLADVAGWRGLFMEADELMYRVLEAKYSAQENVRTIRARVTPENIVDLLARGMVVTEPDVLSIDVDGQDYWIWEAIEGYRPRVVIVEYNSALDPRRRLVQPNQPDRSWDGTDYFGASLGALQALAERKGYQLVHTDLSGANAFFVRSDLAAGTFPAVADIAVRGAPNYFQSGYRHPASGGDGRYLDLDSGELVAADPAPTVRRT
jgi:glycosyltransferase involved in cell wall biosynthesis